MGVLLELDATNRVPKSKKSRYSKSRDPGVGAITGVALSCCRRTSIEEEMITGLLFSVLAKRLSLRMRYTPTQSRWL